MKQTIELHKRWKDDPSKGEVFTPIQLVREMLDKIPLSVWENPESKFLDPCMGKGTFLIEIINRLVYIYGYSKEDAISRVYGYDVCVKYINYLKRGGLKNVFHKDFLNEEFNMKFDVVIGNPPYQGKNKQDKLWVKFLLKSFEITKDSGYIFMINPNSWTKRPESKSFGRITKLFNEKQLVYVKLDVSYFFEGIGEKIGYQLIKNINKNSETIIELINNQIISIDYFGQKIVSNDSEKLVFSIFDKVEKSSHERISKFFSKRDASDAGRSLRDGKFKKQPEGEYNIPLLYTLNQTYYVKNNGYCLSTKFFFNFSGYYYKENNPEKYMPILTGYISGQATFSVEVPTIEKGNILRHNYSRKLMRFYNDKFKTGGFNTGVPNLPWLGYTDILSDNDLYSKFGLTTNEIELIEMTYD
jgi:predicted RNA methylase